MTDAVIRKRVTALMKRRAPRNSPEVIDLYGQLSEARGKECADFYLTAQDLAAQPGTSGEQMKSLVRTLLANFPGDPPIVLSIHGINTTGAWQKDFDPILHDAKLKPYPLDYGSWNPLRLPFSGQRQKRIEAFFQKYSEVRGAHPDIAISICAHSFGTYIVGYAMQKYPQISFDQIILCGSILPVTFPWDQLIRDGRVRRVLNECGGQDIWVRLAGWIVGDAGPSGCSGFNAECDGLLQRRYGRYKHSDFFHPLQFKESWVPFLAGGDPPPDTVEYCAPRNLRPLLTKTVLLVVLAGIAWLGWWCFK